MVFDYIEKYPHRTKQILGISYEQLQSLLNCAIKRHQEIKTKQESRKIRINAAGGGRKEKLLIQEQVCLCLFYLRQMPTFQVLGMLFGVSKTEANDTFHEWIPILRDILPSSLLEQVSNNESDLLFVQELLTTFRLLVDSLKQPIYRNSDQKEQQKYNSFKKTQHILKSLVVGIPKGKDIVEVEIGVPGPTADIKLFRKSQNKFDKSQPFLGDKGFKGGENINTPHKKKPKRELTQQQKDENKALSSNRIFIEHLIRLLKIFRISSQRFRLNLETYEQIILTVCGLVRLRIGSLILPT
ncbi:transposase family protein [Nostoc flagelliforme FACHB-838]|uniref:Transposase family protein n=1 Tax=Nostoc flagelliforme FACHB-838 TaxID=2692904 RepID=A0ABR8DYT2_9NOSO|nr:transposase family protein [Nostoc flagelliforme]MBD2534637.1 transposase family protein [Nostoc flagelliforme FACHB-838]